MAPRLESDRAGDRARRIAGPPGSGIKGEVTFVEPCFRFEYHFPEPGVDVEAAITGPPGCRSHARQA